MNSIIPRSLGGSNRLVIREASKKANNDLGADVDAPFVNSLPLAIKRHRLKLESQGGNISPIVWKGLTPEGIGAKMKVLSDGNIVLDFDRKFVRPDESSHGKLIVGGTLDTITPMLEGLIQKMKRRG